jgi:hypothetical protein
MKVVGVDATTKPSIISAVTVNGPQLDNPSQISARVIQFTLALGLILRLVQYLLDRSLWLDEAQLALNITHRSFAGLLKPLDYHQGAPVGFLLLEKAVAYLLGRSEYALRLLPLIAGIASLFLFYKLAKETISPHAVTIAVGLFAISPSLVYYSSEVKQYSTDVAAALAIYSIALVGKSSEWSTSRMAALGLVGAASIWISHPSAFVLAGIGLSAGVVFCLRKQWNALARFSLAACMWVVSLGISYLFFLRTLARDHELLDYWAGNFMPLPPKSISDFSWFVHSFFGFFGQTASLQMEGLAALTFVTGAAYMYSRDRVKLSFLLLPALLTLCASGLHKYPFGGRLLLFLVPAALLVIAEGARQIVVATRPSATVVGYALIVLLFLDPSIYLLHHFGKPHTLVPRMGTMLPEEIKPVMAYVHAHQKSGDVVYLITGSQPAYQYYDELYRIRENNLLLGTALGDDAKDYVTDLDRLRGRRAWIVASHISGRGAIQLKYIEFYLAMAGRRIDQFTAAGASAYLYDLNVASGSHVIVGKPQT